MAWATPPTFTANNVLTAAQQNILSGDLNETAPAKADVATSGFIVTSGVNQVVRRSVFRGIVATNQTTTSTTYTDLATQGPDVTVTTGTQAIVTVTSIIKNDTVGQNSYASYNVSGATTIAADDPRAVFITASSTGGAIRASTMYLETGLTAGSNTFRMKYRVTANTGTFGERMIVVIGM
ncbi:hypothetical protein [Tenggerimyces flavus]|uniref:Uncharacterized protein n=1 Tax=Tenggerimyces flavus TaxID=1708749 RepID=A0ABV7YA37_9ACTN|nr:hypothetical protein [Tenggerimyces flavus]MBM7788846.1 hypothetical protein [Tenggerimyces flavus]